MKRLILLFLLPFSLTSGYSQILINEASNSNYTQIADGSNDFSDWIELYNAGAEKNTFGYFLSDSKSDLTKWPLPAIQLGPNQHLLIFASGEDNTGENVHHWETAVMDDDTWKWINPDATTGNDWPEASFDDSGWADGRGGFGFEDGDDLTILADTSLAVYTRIRFSIADTSVLQTAVLHMDYDDGFIAYLNGQEVARSNVSGLATWNTPADDLHEAVMYQGFNPEEYRLDMTLVKQGWTEGENVLAIHVMNQGPESTDMTCRAFLSFGLKNASEQFRTPPFWFGMQTATSSHANFKIDANGETIYLSNANGLKDSLKIPGRMPLNSSFGRIKDGVSNYGIFLSSTPGARNNEERAYTEGTEASPTMDIESGFYEGTINVSIEAASPSVEIRYTLDGQTPQGGSTLYTGPIQLDASTVLKARSFGSSGKLPSETTTNTYLINEPNNTNAGVLSISTNVENLYGATGIYDNWWMDWKKPSYIEYFAPGTHELVFEQRAALRIDGGAGGSRSQPQRSFRVEPGHGTLGDGNLQYPLQPGRPHRQEYETFYLRNGSNQYLFYPIKDAIQTKCLAFGTNTPYSEYTPVHVYLNGAYWGWYELREKQDADYFEQNYGIDKDSLELLGASYYYGGVLRAIEGKNAVENFDSDFKAFLDLSIGSDTYWEDADQYFDMPNYVDYVCMQSWIANTDWPYNNIKIFRGPQTENKWRFGVIDVEWGLSPNGWTDSNFDHISFMKSYSYDYPYLYVWQKSILNNTFKANFINRFADLMNTNWHPDSLKAIADEIYYSTRPEMGREFQRWGESSDVASQMATFDVAHQTMLTELATRSAKVRDHLLTNFGLPKTVTITLDVAPEGAGQVKISTVIPTQYPWEGIYFDGIPVTIEAIANPGFIFLNWEANGLLSSLSEETFSGLLTASSTFKANFETNGLSNQVTISEINYNSPETMDAEDWVEFWNYSGTAAADISGWYFTDDDPTHRYTFPSNTVLPANTGVVVVNSSEAFSSVYPAVAHLGNIDFNFGNGGDAVRLYDFNNNLIASVVYGDEAPWPAEADGTGKTLERKNPDLPSEEAGSWFAGCVGGSPGVAFESPCEVLTALPEVAIPYCTLYPNPTRGKFKLESSDIASDLLVIDFTGKVVYATSQITQDHEIDLTGSANGIYLVRVIFNNSHEQTFRVIRH